MDLIHWMTSSFFPEKSAGRVALSSEVCNDIAGGAVGVGPTGVLGVPGLQGVLEARRLLVLEMRVEQTGGFWVNKVEWQK